MGIEKLAKMNNDQLYLGSTIMFVCQDMMNDLEDLCLKLGTELTRVEVIEIVKVRFNTKLDALKLEIPPKEER